MSRLSETRVVQEMLVQGTFWISVVGVVNGLARAKQLLNLRLSVRWPVKHWSLMGHQEAIAGSFGCTDLTETVAVEA